MFTEEKVSEIFYLPDDITAKHLLTSTNLIISGIAYKLNFSDQSAFGKFFKAYTGMYHH